MLSADLVDLRDQKPAKDVAFKMDYPGITNGTFTPFQYDPKRVDYTLPVGEVVALDLDNVDDHPFHIHINPFQLTTNTPVSTTNKWNRGWFQSGDWHDTLFNPDNGTQRVLMQTDP